jgi:hypothetical protein
MTFAEQSLEVDIAHQIVKLGLIFHGSCNLFVVLVAHLECAFVAVVP